MCFDHDSDQYIDICPTFVILCLDKCGTGPTTDGIFYITHARSVNLSYYLFRQTMISVNARMSAWSIYFLYQLYVQIQSLLYTRANDLNDMKSWFHFEQSAFETTPYTCIYGITYICWPQDRRPFYRTDFKQSTLPHRGPVMLIFDGTINQQTSRSNSTPYKCYTCVDFLFLVGHRCNSK